MSWLSPEDRKCRKLGCMMNGYFPTKSEATWRQCFPGLSPGRRSTKSHKRVIHRKSEDEASGRRGAERIEFGVYWACGGWRHEFGVYWACGGWRHEFGAYLAYLSRLSRSKLVSGRCC